MEFFLKNEYKITDEDFENADCLSCLDSGEQRERANEHKIIESSRTSETRSRVENMDTLKNDRNHYIGSQGQLCVKINGNNYVGSGILFRIRSLNLNTNFFLTCAHNCMTIRQGFNFKYDVASSSVFHFRKNKGKYDCASTVTSFKVFPGYCDSKENMSIFSGYDLALGVCGEELNEHLITKNFLFGNVDAAKSGDKIALAGYPGEYKGDLYYMEGSISEIYAVDDERKFIFYKDIDTTKGQSGSPVYCKNGESWSVIGIHLGYCKEKSCNIAIGFTKSKLNWMISTLNSTYS